MRNLFILLTLLCTLCACIKTYNEEAAKQLPDNVDVQHLISAEQAIDLVKKMMSTLDDMPLAKSMPTEFETKVKTDFQNIPFINLTKSGTSFKDSVQVPIYTIELTENKSGKKATFMFIGDSRVGNPFVAFSENEMFDLSNIPEFEAYFNNNLKNYIHTELQQNVILTKGITPPYGYQYCNSGPSYKIEWEDIMGPLITKISWNQSQSPENDSVKICSITGLNTPAGCLAVAIAQILSYHEYPTSGSYLHKESNHIISTTYNWNLMTSVMDPSQTANTTIRSQVANIHAEVGYWANITYGCGGSSGTLDNGKSALYVMGYTNTIKLPYSSSFSATLRNEIDNNRPVLIYGKDFALNAGHFWVLDGYKTAFVEKGTIYYCFKDNNYGPDPDLVLYEPDEYREAIYYRCKLGWGPSSDQYFLDHVITVTRDNITYHLNYDNWAITNIYH